MSEGSLPPFGLSGTRSARGLLGRALGLVFGRRRSRKPDPPLEARARSEIELHAREHAALFERAERLGLKARRLDEAGTPSESAGNRAARARGEVEAGLAILRARFVASEGEVAGEAFDREASRRLPAPGSYGQGA